MAIKLKEQIMQTKNTVLITKAILINICHCFITIITTITLLTTINNAHAFVDVDINNNKPVFFDTNPDLFYKIGGVSRLRQPLTPNTNVRIDLGGRANLGYSCGEFDISAAFANLMDNFKNGVDDAVNSVVGTINAGVSALPALVVQRAMPGVYDMFQEYKLDAETDISIARASCEQIEAQIAQGDNPYEQFIQDARSQTWRDEARKGTTITKAREVSQQLAADNGVSYFGEQVGGTGQPPMRVVESGVVAGFNYALGNTNNPTQHSSAPAGTELERTFPSSDEAAIWATDVLGEFEVNNKEPITKIGSGLHPKVKREKQLAMQQFKQEEYSQLGFGPKVINKINNLSIKDQDSVYANLIDDIAIERTINKALIIRRLLLSASQAQASDQRDKKIALLERDIDSLMFERKIKQSLANRTMLDVLRIIKVDDAQGGFGEVDDNPFL